MNATQEKIQQYLFANGPNPFSEKNYRFLLIDFDDAADTATVFAFLKELFPDACFFQKGKDHFLFYFQDPDFNLKELFGSISDDFSVALRVYVSGKVSAKKPEHFRILYGAYKEFLENSPHQYMTNAELIGEVIKSDFPRLKEIRAAVLNRIAEDAQTEKLILAMFENDLNVKRTAEAAFMHRNTVIRKLEWIKQETGLNLQRFSDAACLYWLLRSK